MPPKYTSEGKSTINKVYNVQGLSQPKYRAFVAKIFQKLIKHDKPTRDKNCVIIYGTPGAGKTTGTQKYLKEQFPKSQRFLIIDRDELTFNYTTYFSFMRKYLKSIKMDKNPNQILSPKNITTPAVNQYYRHLKFFLQQGNIMMNSLVELALRESFNMVIYDPPYRFRFSDHIPYLNKADYQFHLAYMFTPQKKIKQNLKSRNKDNLIILSDSALRRLTTITVSDFVYLCLDGHDNIDSCTIIDNSGTKTEMSQIRDWDFIYRFQKRGAKPSGYERIKYN
jgi:GTPase SAR1 family protein